MNFSKLASSMHGRLFTTWLLSVAGFILLVAGALASDPDVYIYMRRNTHDEVISNMALITWAVFWIAVAFLFCVARRKDARCYTCHSCQGRFEFGETDMVGDTIMCIPCIQKQDHP